MDEPFHYKTHVGGWRGRVFAREEQSPTSYRAIAGKIRRKVEQVERELEEYRRFLAELEARMAKGEP